MWGQGVLVILMRIGLLPGVTAMFVTLVVASAVPSLDFSSWYADRALVPIAVLAGILVYGAATALAGRAIFGDPLKDAPGR